LTLEENSIREVADTLAEYSRGVVILTLIAVAVTPLLAASTLLFKNPYSEVAVCAVFSAVTAYATVKYVVQPLASFSFEKIARVHPATLLRVGAVLIALSTIPLIVWTASGLEVAAYASAALLSAYSAAFAYTSLALYRATRIPRYLTTVALYAFTAVLPFTLNTAISCTALIAPHTLNYVSTIRAINTLLSLISRETVEKSVLAKGLPGARGAIFAQVASNLRTLSTGSLQIALAFLIDLLAAALLGIVNPVFSRAYVLSVLYNPLPLASSFGYARFLLELANGFEQAVSALLLAFTLILPLSIRYYLVIRSTAASLAPASASLGVAGFDARVLGSLPVFSFFAIHALVNVVYVALISVYAVVVFGDPLLADANLFGAGFTLRSVFSIAALALFVLMIVLNTLFFSALVAIHKSVEEGLEGEHFRFSKAFSNLVAAVYTLLLLMITGLSAWSLATGVGSGDPVSAVLGLANSLLSDYSLAYILLLLQLVAAAFNYYEFSRASEAASTRSEAG